VDANKTIFKRKIHDLLKINEIFYILEEYIYISYIYVNNKVRKIVTNIKVEVNGLGNKKFLGLMNKIKAGSLKIPGK
jgi:hypothetical protein